MSTTFKFSIPEDFRHQGDWRIVGNNLHGLNHGTDEQPPLPAPNIRARGGAPTVVDGAAYGDGGTYPFASLLDRPEVEDGPKAYLTWLVFDEDMHFLVGESGYSRLTTAAREAGTNVPHELLLMSEKEIKVPGYVYIYLSNEEEGPLDVFFDDLQVTHTLGPVVQANDYYPFGLTFNSYQRENSKANKYLYSEKELQDDLDLGLFDFAARMYDPALGRFNSVDPHADRYEITSPYNYAFNNPLLFVDPTGKDNIIYLILAGDFDKKTAQTVANQANAIFKEMGLETRVQVYDSEKNGDFKSENLDDTDNWAVIGNDRKAIVETANAINPDWVSGYLEDGTKPWSGNDNPETANQTKKGDGRGILIDHKNNISKAVKSVSKEEGSGLVLVHGAGHSAKRIINNKTLGGEYGHTDTGIMQDGNGLVNDLNRGGRSKVVDKKQNETYIRAMMERYGTNKATDNYSKNKGKR
jgi:RHS repeat-associated protein